MSLAPGTRLGPYEVSSQIGVGGMGEVYRGTDTNLARQVAIKVLPDAVAQDPERLARFDREAKTLAALNHPNIAQVYGLERTEGIVALVMELVEGEDLSTIIANGQPPLEGESVSSSLRGGASAPRRAGEAPRGLSLDDALPIARQIVDALEAAHDQGIIHRDLKPANVKVRDDGTVKVLDFGLAKVLEPADLAASSPDASRSPTITSPAMTQMGVILGTAAYMSPEQARGKPVDERADVWALGCVLYEMLTGLRLFEGEDVSMTLAAVLQADVAFDALPAQTPARVRQVLSLCLQRDPKQRLHDMADVRLALAGAFETPASPHAATAAPLAPWQRPLPGALAVLALLTAAVAGTWALIRPPPPEPRPLVRLANPFDAGQEPIGAMSFTPDGAALVYLGPAGPGQQPQIWIRRWADLEATPIRGTEGAATFALSPDGREVAFAPLGGALRVVPVDGGPGRTLTEKVLTVSAWAPDGAVYFTGSSQYRLERLPSTGGDAQAVTELREGEGFHGYLSLLPRGSMSVFQVSVGSAAELWTLDLRSGERRPLTPGSVPHYASSGHLLFGTSEGLLMAAPIEPGTAELTGPAVPVLEGLRVDPTTGTSFATSARGTLIYLGGSPILGRTLVRVDRQKRETALDVPPHLYTYPRLSPDGRRVAIPALDETADVFVWDRPGELLTNVTASDEFDSYALWTADGRHLIVSSNETDAQNARLYLRSSDGTGTAEPLTENAPGEAQAPSSLTPDGAYLLFRKGPDTNFDLGMLSLAGNGETEDLLATDARELNAEISPNGRWIAYQSDRSGRYEIYVSPFPDAASSQRQVSVAGGTRPAWAPNGRELYYVDDLQRLMSVGVRTDQPSFASTPAVELFDASDYVMAVGTRPGRTYDVDGDGFLLLKDVEADLANAGPRQVLIQNWFGELQRQAPGN